MVEQQRELLVAATNEDEEIVKQAVESFVELKQMKAKAKSTSTKVRRCSLVLIQDEEVNIKTIHQMRDTLDESEQETMDIMIRLSEKYKGEQDSKSCCKLSQEMEQLETEYTSAQNRAQEVLDSKSVKLSKKSAYQRNVYDSGSLNVRIPEQNQLQPAPSNQPTANNGNVAELPVFGSSFLNE